MIRFEPILATVPRFSVMLPIIKTAIETELQAARGELGQFFMTWSGKPDINTEVEIVGDQIVGAAYLTGSQGILDIVRFVVYGTSPHEITPKGEGYPLRFPETYTPKTQPGVIQSVPGGKDWEGNWVATFQVHHPGNEPRRTFEVIAEHRQKFWRLKMVRAVKTGLREAIRRGVKR